MLSSLNIVMILGNLLLTFIVDAKKKKEQKQMEKELHRLHLISGKTATESK